MSERALPFLRWPGGKRWLVPKLAPLFERALAKRYIEPFLGGGAVFFGLEPSVALLADINSDLINVYKQVRDTHADLVVRLRTLPVNAVTYNQLRRSRTKDPLERAAHFLYLNRTAYAGIYRLNQFGEFNVPFGGGQRRPDLLWTRRLLERASVALAAAQLAPRDFEETLADAGKGDFIYCDPTYTVSHNNNGFRRYNERNFSWADQERLAVVCDRARRKGAVVVVSNAYHDDIASLYPGFLQKGVKRYSCLPRNSSQRKYVWEYLFIGVPNRR